MSRSQSHPYFALTQKWIPAIEFGPNETQAELSRLADWIVSRTNGIVSERYGSENSDSKQYVWIDTATTRLMLMRSGGIGLVAQRFADFMAVAALADEIGAEVRGSAWFVWHFYKLKSRVTGRPTWFCRTAAGSTLDDQS